jgi:hypothetical protein
VPLTHRDWSSDVCSSDLRVQSYLNTKNGPDTSPSSLPTLKSPADIKTLGLKSGDHFLTPDGREKIVP